MTKTEEVCTCGPADLFTGGDGGDPQSDCPQHWKLSGADYFGQPEPFDVEGERQKLTLDPDLWQTIGQDKR